MNYSINLEKILFDFGIGVEFFYYLSWVELINIECVNQMFLKEIRASEILWRDISRVVLIGKAYYPSIVSRLLTDGNSVHKRIDLINYSIKELKLLAVKYGLNITTCFEKAEIISVVNKREIKHKLKDECLSRFALRIAYIDRTRNCITEEELCSFDWNIRVKSNGALASLVPNDPWWDSSYPVGIPTTTIIKFTKDSMVTFEMHGPSPFQDMLVNNNRTSYYIQSAGTSIYLSFGVQELVARHPINWGFILQSSGSVWSSFIMPKCYSDPYLDDDNVFSLVKQKYDFGFIL